MTPEVNKFSLSKLRPIKFVYDYGTKQTFVKDLIYFNGGFGYYKHEALQNYKDAALSRKNCLFLTDVKSLKSVFENQVKEFDISKISGSLYLKVGNKYITESRDQLFVGGIGRPLFFNIVPLNNGLVELRVNRTKYIEIDREYPYTARLSEEILDPTEQQFRQFEVEYGENLVSFRVKTNEGFRFLSYGSDGVVRAIGLELNDTIVNSYHFAAEFVTAPTLKYNFEPTNYEVKYFNDLYDQTNKTNLNISKYTEKNTSLLISCPTNKLSETDEVNVNISILKDYFSSTGTFLPSI